ncbi:MAG: TetR/AcrR family transcriptional regulator C-terminal domain-containing protein [Lachnospiraceae bacterium]|nr:TetR/AcrR family transcriptional regulator C-terminal domain-containing protein [Lachnospiraceae bacterium]
MGKSDVIKREFARTLKQMASEQALSSVTVSSLCAKTGLSRSTFYYHFIDLYDLINWIFDTEIILPLQNYLCSHEVGNWAYGTRMSLETMFADRIFYCQAVKMDVQNSLQDFMRQRNRDSWELLLGRYLEGTHQQYDPETLDFLTTFIAQAISNMTIDWAKDGMKTPVDRMCKMNEVATMGVYGIINRANELRKT